LGLDPELSRNIKACPIEIAMGYLGRKWSLLILRDLFFGRTRFTQFLAANPGLSTKVLSTRLRDLVGAGVVEKRISSTDPVLIEYVLTPRGRALSGVMVELAAFSMEQYPDSVFHKVPDSMGPYIEGTRHLFGGD
jgi:DNA-binding HxlR family transcriptional regulator